MNPGFEPYANVKDLPAHAPIQTLRPTDFPSAAEWTAALAAAGIDPASGSSSITAIVGRGWSFWLLGGAAGGAVSFRAMVLDRRYRAVWARSGDLRDPVSALAQVMAICLANPPAESR